MFQPPENMKNILIISLLFLGIAGCASAPTYTRPVAPAAQTMPGIYHRIEKGQTLWRVSRIYGVDLEELVRVNRIADAKAIEIGQQVFIPNRLKPASQPAKDSDSEDFIWPVRGKVIFPFGQTYNNMLNKGINIQPYGSWEVLASRSGRVVFTADDFIGFGKTVIIEHTGGLFTVYARNSALFVKPGDNVQKGMLIAKAGASGRDRNTYLHFEVRRGAIPQNPLFYLPQ